MPRSRIAPRRALAATLTCLTLGGAFALPAVSTANAKPPKVTVEVLGKPPAEKLLLKRTVTLTSTAVKKDGGSCSGMSAAGALQLATKGAWAGTWSSSYSDYEVTKIAGLYLPFESKAPANWYWSFWVGGKEATAGVCAVKPKSGQKLLFKPACFGKSCPKPKAKRSALSAGDSRRN